MDLKRDEAQILEILKADSKTPLVQIAKQTGLRPSTVHAKIKRMVDRGIIKRFTVDVDQKALGRDLTVFMLVSGGLERYIGQDIEEDQYVEEIHGITGDYDLLLKLRFRDIGEFNRFIVGFRERYNDQINKTVTMVQTARIKE